MGKAKSTTQKHTDLKPGDVVLVRKDHGKIDTHTVTREPWQLGHGTWVIGLSDRNGGYALGRVVGVVRVRDEDKGGGQ